MGYASSSPDSTSSPATARSRRRRRIAALVAVTLTALCLWAALRHLQHPVTQARAIFSDLRQEPPGQIRQFLIWAGLSPPPRRLSYSTAAGELASLGRPAMPALIEAVQGNHREARAAAAVAMRRLADPAAVPSLLKALDITEAEDALLLPVPPPPTPLPPGAAGPPYMPHPWMEECIRTLGDIGDPRAVPRLGQLMRPAAPYPFSYQHEELAARALLKCGPAGIQEVMAVFTSDDPSDLARGAADGLSRWIAGVQPPPIDALLATLQSPAGRYRHFIVEVLIQLFVADVQRPRIHAALFAALQDQDALVRLDVVTELPDSRHAAYQQLRLIPPLLEITRRDPDDQVTIAAIEALSSCHDPEFVPDFIRLAGDPRPTVRCAALTALSGYSDQRAADALLASLSSPTTSASQLHFTVEAYHRLRDPRAVPRLLEIFAGPAHPHGVIEAIANQRDPRAFSTLLRLIEQGDTLSDAVAGLRRLRDARAVEPLIAALDQRKKGDNYAEDICRALGDLGDRRAVAPLLRQLDVPDQGDSPLIYQAAVALGKLGDDRAIDPLIAALNRGSGVAACALGNFNQPRVIAALLPALARKDLRFCAAQALAQLNQPQGLQVLSDALRSPNDEDHRVAIQCLGYSRHPAAVEILLRARRESTVVRNDHYYAHALGDIHSDAAIAALIAMLKDPRDPSRGSVAYVLGKLGERRALEDLEQLRRTATDLATRASANQALQMLSNLQLPADAPRSTW